MVLNLFEVYASLVFTSYTVFLVRLLFWEEKMMAFNSGKDDDWA